MNVLVNGKIIVMKDNEFDRNRHVPMVIYPDEKKVVAHILCKQEDFMEKFHKTVRSLGKRFSGYTVEANIPLAFSGKLTVTARIH